MLKNNSFYPYQQSENYASSRPLVFKIPKDGKDKIGECNKDAIQKEIEDKIKENIKNELKKDLKLDIDE